MSVRLLRAARAINWFLALIALAYQGAMYFDSYAKQDSPTKQAAFVGATLVVSVIAYCSARIVDALLRLWIEAREPKKR